MGIHQENDFAAPVTKGRIRMAYALGNGQPVLCTLLCDQPLYYMEDEIMDDEHDSLFLEEEQSINAALGADLGSIQKKIGIYDGLARKFAAGPDGRLQQFTDNASSFGAAPADAQTFLHTLLPVLGQSRHAQSLLDMAAAHGVDIRSASDVRDAVYNEADNLILVNPQQTTADALLSLTRALRRHAQCRHGAGAHPLSFHPDEAVFVNRAQAADLAVTQVRVAWELQLAGINEPWARLENSQGCDLGRAFAREALCDFRTLNNGKAAQAAFESWFLSDRCKIEDRDLIQAMLSDQEARLFAETQQQVNPAFIAALGEQPSGKNYLAELAPTLLSDPIFSDVRDRSNANFLWFVKFERSFKETEQVLQGAEETIHSFESPQIATLVSLKNDSISAAYERTKAEQAVLQELTGLESGMNQSNIVYVRFGR